MSFELVFLYFKAALHFSLAKRGPFLADSEKDFSNRRQIRSFLSFFFSAAPQKYHVYPELSFSPRGLLTHDSLSLSLSLLFGMEPHMDEEKEINASEKRGRRKRAR